MEKRLEGMLFIKILKRKEDRSLWISCIDLKFGRVRQTVIALNRKIAVTKVIVNLGDSIIWDPELIYFVNKTDRYIYTLSEI